MGVRDNPASIRNARKRRRKAKLLRQQQSGKRSRTEALPSKAGRQKAGREACDLWTPSLNGIFVNGVEVSARVIVLVPGDEVSLVGPTDRGKSLDHDCPAAIGFRVDARPAAKRPQAATSSLSLQSEMEPTVGDNLQGSKTSCMLYDPKGSRCQQIDLYNMHCTETESLPVKLMQRDHNVSDRSAHECTLTETTDRQRGGSRGQQSNRCFTGSSRLQVPQPHETSFTVDLDQRLLSIFNLVETSTRLRSDLLSCYPAGSSTAAEVRKDLQITAIHSNERNSICDDIFTECTMHTIENTIKSCEDPLEMVVGECANEKTAGVSPRHTDQVGSFQSTHSIRTDNCLTKNKACRVAGREDDGLPSSLPASSCDRERFLEGASDADQNLPIYCGDSSSCQKVRTSNFLTQMFDIVTCEKRPVTTCATATTVKWNLLGGLTNENLPTRDTIDGLQTLAHEGIKEDNAVEKKRCRKHPAANNVSLTMTEVAMTNLTVIEAGGLFDERQACLNVNISNFQFPENYGTKGSDIQEKAWKDDVCNLRGTIESGFNESVLVSVRLTQAVPENSCHQLLKMDVALPDCLIESVCPSVSITPYKNIMTADDYSISDLKLVPCKRDQGNVTSENEEHTQKENSRLQDKVSIAKPQLVLQHTCVSDSLQIEDDTVSINKITCVVKSSIKENDKQEEMDAVEQSEQQCVSAHLNVKKHVIDLPVGGPCHKVFKEADLDNEEVVLCTNHGNVGKVVGFSTTDMGLIERNEEVSPMLRLDEGSKHVDRKEQNWNMVKVDEPFKVEANKQLQHHDTCSSQRLPATVQDSDAQQTRGYYLNQLEGVAAMRHSDKDNIVNLWDLLNLSDDVQALFIGTFTYDLEWYCCWK